MNVQTTSGTNLGDQVATAILRMIASGDVTPGDRLPAERRLAEQLNVSRVSVRAGLQKLKAQGMLVSVRGGGTRVAEPDGRNGDPALAALVEMDRGSLADLVDIRAILEVWAVRRAAERANEDDIERINQLIADMSDPEQDRATLDVDFHLAIAKASGSVVYRHLLSVIRSTLEEMLRFHRFELFDKPEHDVAIAEQHKIIAKAISDHDPRAAENAMYQHLEWVRAHYILAGHTNQPE